MKNSRAYIEKLIEKIRYLQNAPEKNMLIDQCQGYQIKCINDGQRVFPDSDRRATGKEVVAFLEGVLDGWERCATEIHTYNGWKNYATWFTFSCLINNEESLRWAHQMVSEDPSGGSIKEKFDNMVYDFFFSAVDYETVKGTLNLVLYTVLGAQLLEIDWQRIATAITKDL